MTLPYSKTGAAPFEDLTALIEELNTVSATLAIVEADLAALTDTVTNLNHASLMSLAWDESGHTGPIESFAYFDSDGVATAILGSNMLVQIGAQSHDDLLDSLASLVTAADKGLYFTGEDNSALFDLTSFARTLLDDNDAGAMRTTLGLIIGTHVQAYDSELAAIAGLVSAADRVPYFTGSGTASLATLTSFIRTLLDDADAAAARATLAALGGSLGATDNAILRADGAGGSTAQGSGLTCDDSGVLTFPGAGGPKLTAPSGYSNVAGLITMAPNISKHYSMAIGDGTNYKNSLLYQLSPWSAVAATTTVALATYTPATANTIIFIIAEFIQKQDSSVNQSIQRRVASFDYSGGTLTRQANANGFTGGSVGPVFDVNVSGGNIVFNCTAGAANIKSMVMYHLYEQAYP